MKAIDDEPRPTHPLRLIPGLSRKEGAHEQIPGA
jgi:hypothetical protein